MSNESQTQDVKVYISLDSQDVEKYKRKASGNQEEMTFIEICEKYNVKPGIICSTYDGLYRLCQAVLALILLLVSAIGSGNNMGYDPGTYAIVAASITLFVLICLLIVSVLDVKQQLIPLHLLLLLKWLSLFVIFILQVAVFIVMLITCADRFTGEKFTCVILSLAIAFSLIVSLLATKTELSEVLLTSPLVMKKQKRLKRSKTGKGYKRLQKSSFS